MPVNSFLHAPIFKMNGLGNRITILDLRDRSVVAHAPQALFLNQQERFAFDQLMVIYDPRTAGTQAYVEIFNQDGSMAGACGNGTRCVAWVLSQRVRSSSHCLLETQAGLLTCIRLDPTHFSVDMGQPRVKWDQIPLARALDTAHIPAALFEIPTDVCSTPLPDAVGVNMGNPHVVFLFEASDPYPAASLPQLGPFLESNPLLPELANISFARILSRTEIDLTVWERGTGFTQACGTGACATLVAAVRRGMTARTATIHLPGGPLSIAWDEASQRVIMTGPVALELATYLTSDYASALAT